ncbi:MAG TPA: DUF72 domain-containing protein [Cyclobacteriaceae bacterium]|nr:DUF72 domain-containing protein [Cyclobacteriaceae bacterium]
MARTQAMESRIHVGTSGWNYKHWIDNFYPTTIKSNELLEYYSLFFDTVELNSSFYHLPSQTTFRSWRENTPDHFLFSVKGSRYITHMKKLKDVNDAVDKIIDHSQLLAEKRGPILFQLPPGWNVNERRLDSFLKILPRGLPYAFEFRNHSWYDPIVYSLLEKYNCAFCIYELNGHLSPVTETGDFVYIRLHGPAGKYQGRYSNAALRIWRDRCREWVDAGKDVFIYFDNDQNAYAVYNALELKELL